jgi:hypothetical protein
MGHMKKYRCPQCSSTHSVIGYGRRKQVLRYFCKACHHHFSYNPCFRDTKAILSDHLDGFSFRTLARKYDISPMNAWRICEEELKKLPDNNQFTFQYCNRFSQILVCDGKYFNVASQPYDWVLLWGFDYFRHDIPVILVAPAESYASWAKFFTYFRIINNYPRLVVCDDNVNEKMAARAKLPGVKIQACYNHFKENIRRTLKIRSDETYRTFMHRVEDVFVGKRADEDRNKRLFSLFQEYQSDPACVAVLMNIQKYSPELLAYRGIPAAPTTSNIIEGMNSHIEARLHSLRSFQSPTHAKLWFNGFILKRRFTPFTDCRGKFKHLNGKSGVQMTKKPELVLPTLFS